MRQNRKNHIHETNREEIKAIAWEQIGENGVTDLSLRAIARAMDVTAPALYRYFASRDDLMTALINDAYESFADALTLACVECAAEDYAGRFFQTCLAYRQWAITYPQRYMLIFGAPVAGYREGGTPLEAGDRCFLILLEMLESADRAGKIQCPRVEEFPSGLSRQLEALHRSGNFYSPQITYLALSAWSFIHGIAALEISRRYTIMLADHVDEFFQAEVEQFMKWIGLK